MELQVFLDDKQKFSELSKEEIKQQLKKQGIDLDAEDEVLNEEEKEYRKQQQLLKRLGASGYNEEHEDAIKGFAITLSEQELLDKSAFIATMNIPINQIKAIIKDEVNKIQDKAIMLIKIEGETLECVYDENKFDLITEYINMVDSITLGSLQLNYDVFKSKVKNSSGEEKIIPIGKSDFNKN